MNSAARRICDLFALPATGFEQDWDVELADADRIDEFLRAYEEQNLTDAERTALMSLVIASADAYVAERGVLPERWSDVGRLLLRDEELHKSALEYWRVPDEEDPDGWFHITPALRALG